MISVIFIWMKMEMSSLQLAICEREGIVVEMDVSIVLISSMMSCFVVVRLI
mgnify:CR=1 FL=1